MIQKFKIEIHLVQIRMKLFKLIKFLTRKFKMESLIIWLNGKTILHKVIHGNLSAIASMDSPKFFNFKAAKKMILNKKKISLTLAKL